MAKRKVNNTEDVMVEVQEVEVGSTSHEGTSFGGGNQRLLLGLVGGLMLAALAWFAYKQFVVAPNNKEAMSTSWQAQQQTSPFSGGPRAGMIRRERKNRNASRLPPLPWQMTPV